ncbi:protein of unknown function (plasmid) [Rhodovastum atsumiense]|uniref:hypothetical protein n=1 Tax=Rhodovastum atsumiense TaxID=504468 RepID=UPI00139F2CB2|nr:hypothetical protein [Rhodovastum atsumiense]CAH2606533.1 protein of unknown function [Rhodovastum atsumiense]
MTTAQADGRAVSVLLTTGELAMLLRSLTNTAALAEAAGDIATATRLFARVDELQEVEA